MAAAHYQLGRAAVAPVMVQAEHSWILGQLKFVIASGDLLSAPVEAIVNSEQTDFILSGHPASISGQIRHRLGQAIQDELFEQTGGRILPPGTVLATSGADHRFIFHAGFHHPAVWLDPDEQSSQTEHVGVIRNCIRQILELQAAEGIASTAFPLIGCGLFGLNPAILAYQFVDELSEFQSSQPSTSDREVWLVIHEPAVLPPVLNAAVQAFIDRGVPKPHFETLSLGAEFLDRFEPKFSCVAHPQWAAWMLVRYCELATSLLLFSLEAEPSLGSKPEDLLKEGRPMSFGLVRGTALSLARAIQQCKTAGPWVTFFAELLRRDTRNQNRLLRMNEDRNNIAHGRSFRPVEEIWRDLTQFLQLGRWQELLAKQGNPPLHNLTPWIGWSQPDLLQQPADNRECGVLQRWQGASYHYLIPHSGVSFKLPREA